MHAPTTTYRKVPFEHERASRDTGSHRATGSRVRRMAAVGLVSLAVVVVSSCGGSSDDADDQTTTAPQDTTTVDRTDPGGVPTRPPEGSYAYEGSGREETSSPALVVDQDTDMPATVEWTDPNCFRFRLDYTTDHWRSWDWCITAEGLVETGGMAHQVRDPNAPNSDSEYVCDPPITLFEFSMEIGDRLESTCTGTNPVTPDDTAIAGVNGFIGIEAVDVGETSEQAYHVRATRFFSGAQVGAGSFNVWFAVTDMLPLAMDETVDIATGTPFGDIDYHEDSSWTLTDRPSAE